MLKKYFIPHHKNGYKPACLCAEGAVFILVVILFIEIIFLFQGFILTKTDFFASLFPNAIVAATNEKRMESGTTVLKVNLLLQKAAELKARDMAKNGYFSHNTPDGNTPWSFLDNVKYDYNYAGENLAINFIDSNDVVSAWMNSETHKENLLNKNYTEIGIGTAKGIYEGKETIFVVQFFGSRSEALAKDGVPAEVLPRPFIAEGEEGTKEGPPSFAKVADDKPISLSATERSDKNLNNNSAVISVNKEKEIEMAKSSAQNLMSGKIQEVAPPVSKKTVSKILSAETGMEIAKDAKENAKQIIAMPRKTANYFLVVLFTIILLALALKIFIKIKIQHPSLIINGALLLIIIAAALALNEYLILSEGRII